MATKNVNAEAVQAEETEKKEAVNILDLLLGSDVGEIKLPTKEVEITRLSQVYGAPFILTIKAITPAKFEEIQDMSIDVKGKDADIDITQLQLFTVIEGVVDATGAPMFKNKELMSKFKVSTPKDLVRAILLSGEIAKIYGEISELAGFGDNAVKRSKKLISTDGLTQMMYYYWKHGRVLPSVFYKLPRGELLVLQAFYEQERDDNNKELERADKSKSVMYNINLLT